MSKMIKIKRGLDQDRANYTPALGELIWVTDDETLWIGDGTTLGGHLIVGDLDSLYIKTSEKGVAQGVATLNGDGTLPNDQLPDIAITTISVVDNENDQLNLDVQQGDVAVRSDQNINYIHNGGISGTIDDWTPLAQSVTLVNGKSGEVELKLDDLTDVDSANLNTNDLLHWDGTNWSPVEPSTVGLHKFIELDDTPINYNNARGKLVQVSDTSDELIFVDNVDGGDF